jgi:hypothetical protein
VGPSYNSGVESIHGYSHIYRVEEATNLKTYWMRNSIFHFAIISNIFSCKRFEDLRGCLHIINLARYENVGRDDPAYDKIHQTSWLVDAIRERCKAAWNLGKKLTIDQMMVRYKGTYSPICQYMPNKPLKWGLKVWCLAYSDSKYVWNFDFYCGKKCTGRSSCESPHSPCGGSYCGGTNLSSLGATSSTFGTTKSSPR